jgi:hypothetical protein
MLVALISEDMPERARVCTTLRSRSSMPIARESVGLEVPSALVSSATVAGEWMVS